MDLGKFKIAHKILGVIALLSVSAAVIAGVGVLSLGTLNDAAYEMKLEGDDEVLAALVGENVLAIKGAATHLAADTSGASLTKVKGIITKQRTELSERLAKAMESADGREKEMLSGIDAAQKHYLAEVDKIMREAEAMAGQVGADRAVLLAAVTASEDEAEKLVAETEAFIAYTSKLSAQLAEEASQTYATASMIMIVVALAGIAGGLLVGWWISQNGIVGPMRQIVACLRALADGRLDTAVFGAERRDEVGDIARTTQVFKENLIAAQKMREAQELERQAKERRQAAINQAVSTFETAMAGIVQGVSSAATQLQSAAGSMTATAEETSKQAVTVAAAAEEAAANVQTVAAATEELTASIKEIGQQVAHSQGATEGAVQEVGGTTKKVQELARASNKIGDVVRLINDIASQTNLLALNATIEAARAGEAGKGFAVVAGEVKSLAAQTAKATEEIADQVNGIQAATRDSVEAIERIGTAIQSINQTATAIAAAVEEQGAATAEIARNVQEAATGTGEVTRNVGGVSQAAGETGSAAAQVLAAANGLSAQSEALRRHFDTFAAQMRAA